MICWWQIIILHNRRKKPLYSPLFTMAIISLGSIKFLPKIKCEQNESFKRWGTDINTFIIIAWMMDSVVFDPFGENTSSSNYLFQPLPSLAWIGMAHVIPTALAHKKILLENKLILLFSLWWYIYLEFINILLFDLYFLFCFFWGNHKMKPAILKFILTDYI